jgi:hypothetical protein
MNQLRALTTIAVLAAWSAACHAQTLPATSRPAADKQAAEIRGLIDQLVFQHARADETPLLTPGIGGDDDKEYKKQFEKCRAAFDRLTELKEAAFPLLVEHLDDKRPSIPFRNHFAGHSVGDACYWCIYYQLQDRPADYSSYGYQRKGRDGKLHPKPYWEGAPFDAAGGLKPWLEQNRNLSYPEKQIKCLNWLLEREKAIGVPDADSYFVNVLPLEIRILERKQETGADVTRQLEELRKINKERIVEKVPKELLPAGP